MRTPIDNFGISAQKLSRNPLGIIALFIVLIYGIACLTFAFSKNLPINTTPLFAYFIALYPIIVLAVFYRLVTKHHTKLYAPRDFERPSDFLECAYGDQNRRFTKIEMISASPDEPKVNVSEKVNVGEEVIGVVKPASDTSEAGELK